MNVPGDLDRSVLNASPYSTNPEMAQAFDDSPVFSAIAAQLKHERDVQAVRYSFVYPISGDSVGQTTTPQFIVIEQGSDFQCCYITARAYSYDANNASSFPVPNALGLTAWAADGLTMAIVDAGASRELTQGFVSFSLLGTPGYGLNFQNPLPWRYLFRRNARIRFDIRNRDAATRTHHYDIALIGYKIYTPA